MQSKYEQCDGNFRRRRLVERLVDGVWEQQQGLGEGKEEAAESDQSTGTDQS